MMDNEVMVTEQLSLFDYSGYKDKIYYLPLDLCVSHPLNPRLAQDEEAITRLVKAIQVEGFGPAHAILVRPLDGKYEILSGHRRREAANRAALQQIPAWVLMDISESKAHSLLLLENEQAELSALEKGKHAYDHIQEYGKGEGGRGKTGGIREYAREHGYGNDVTVLRWMRAYEVVNKSTTSCSTLDATILYEVSKSPEASWSALCQAAGARLGD